MQYPSHRQVVAQITRLEKFLDNWQLIPATGQRNKVFLALLSKALTVGRAICALVKAGFPAEAFGLSRTLMDIFSACESFGFGRLGKRLAPAAESWTEMMAEE